ncbi:MAG: GTPase, partial [Actinomycetota bacterium]|nr:GTPase [Actinomycetota bacterium]
LGGAREWDPPVLETTASDRLGVHELWDAIEGHRAYLGSSGALSAKRLARLLREVEALAAERFRSKAAARLAAEPELTADLEARRIDPYAVAAMLVGKATDS